MFQELLHGIENFEGIGYAFFATMAVLIVRLPIVFVVCREIGKEAFAGKINGISKQK